MTDRISKTPPQSRAKGRASQSRAKRRAPEPPPPEDFVDDDDWDDGDEDDESDRERSFDSDRVYAGALAAAAGSIAKLYPNEDDRQLFAEAAERYARAVERSHRVQAEWEGLGRPTLARGSMGQRVEHPLMKMIREHEREVSVLAKHVGLEPASRARRPAAGRPTGAASAPDRAAPPAVTPSSKARMVRVK